MTNPNRNGSQFNLEPTADQITIVTDTGSAQNGIASINQGSANPSLLVIGERDLINTINKGQCSTAPLTTKAETRNSLKAQWNVVVEHLLQPRPENDRDRRILAERAEAYDQVRSVLGTSRAGARMTIDAIVNQLNRGGSNFDFLKTYSNVADLQRDSNIIEAVRQSTANALNMGLTYNRVLRFCTEQSRAYPTEVVAIVGPTVFPPEIIQELMVNKRSLNDNMDGAKWAKVLTNPKVLQPERFENLRAAIKNFFGIPAEPCQIEKDAEQGQYFNTDELVVTPEALKVILEHPSRTDVSSGLPDRIKGALNKNRAVYSPWAKFDSAISNREKPPYGELVTESEDLHIRMVDAQRKAGIFRRALLDEFAVAFAAKVYSRLLDTGLDPNNAYNEMGRLILEGSRERDSQWNKLLRMSGVRIILADDTIRTRLVEAYDVMSINFLVHSARSAKGDLALVVHDTVPDSVGVLYPARTSSKKYGFLNVFSKSEEETPTIGEFPIDVRAVQALVRYSRNYIIGNDPELSKGPRNRDNLAWLLAATIACAKDGKHAEPSVEKVGILYVRLVINTVLSTILGSTTVQKILGLREETNPNTTEKPGCLKGAVQWFVNIPKNAFKAATAPVRGFMPSGIDQISAAFEGIKLLGPEVNKLTPDVKGCLSFIVRVHWLESLIQAVYDDSLATKYYNWARWLTSAPFEIAVHDREVTGLIPSGSLWEMMDKANKFVGSRLPYFIPDQLKNKPK